MPYGFWLRRLCCVVAFHLSHLLHLPHFVSSPYSLFHHVFRHITAQSAQFYGPHGLRPHIRAAFSWAHIRRRATRLWVPAPTSCAGSVRSQDHVGNAHTIRACGCNRPPSANSPTCSRETRPLVAERNPQIGSSLRHSVRESGAVAAALLQHVATVFV